MESCGKNEHLFHEHMFLRGTLGEIGEVLFHLKISLCEKIYFILCINAGGFCKESSLRRTFTAGILIKR